MLQKYKLFFNLPIYYAFILISTKNIEFEKLNVRPYTHSTYLLMRK